MQRWAHECSEPAACPPHPGVDIVLGCNGTIWLAPHHPEGEGAEEQQQAQQAAAEEEDAEQQAAAAWQRWQQLPQEEQRRRRECVARWGCGPPGLEAPAQALGLGALSLEMFAWRLAWAGRPCTCIHATLTSPSGSLSPPRRAAQAVHVLSQLYLAVHPAAVRQVVALAVQEGCSAAAMLDAGFLRKVAQQEAEARRDAMEEDA